MTTTEADAAPLAAPTALLHAEPSTWLTSALAKAAIATAVTVAQEAALDALHAAEAAVSAAQGAVDAAEAQLAADTTAAELDANMRREESARAEQAVALAAAAAAAAASAAAAVAAAGASRSAATFFAAAETAATAAAARVAERQGMNWHVKAEYAFGQRKKHEELRIHQYEVETEERAAAEGATAAAAAVGLSEPAYTLPILPRALPSAARDTTRTLQYGSAGARKGQQKQEQQQQQQQQQQQEHFPLSPQEQERALWDKARRSDTELMARRARDGGSGSRGAKGRIRAGKAVQKSAIGAAGGGAGRQPAGAPQPQPHGDTALTAFWEVVDKKLQRVQSGAGAGRNGKQMFPSRPLLLPSCAR